MGHYDQLYREHFKENTNNEKIPCKLSKIISEIDDLFKQSKSEYSYNYGYKMRNLLEQIRQYKYRD